jgi:hypothetical protein
MEGIYTHLKSIVFIAYAMSFIVVMFGLSEMSRVQIFGTCLIFLVLNILLYAILFPGKYRDQRDEEEIRTDLLSIRPRISISLLVGDFLVISTAFYLMNLIRRGSFSLQPEYEKILLVILGLWLLFSFLTQKFNIRNFQNLFYAQAACLKCIVFMILAMSVVIFAFRFFYYSRMQIFGFFIVFIVLENVLYYLYFVMSNGEETNGDIESYEEIEDFFGQKELDLNSGDTVSESSSLFMKTLWDGYVSAFPDAFDFIREHIDLDELGGVDSAIMSSPNISNIELLKSRDLRLIFNLNRINDVRWINRYFLEVHKHLQNGGFFIGNAYTIETHKMEFYVKYPKLFRKTFYFLHFVVHRVLPKLPKVRKLYFAVTKGRNRMISRAEVLGRLYFCGFKVVAERIIDNHLFYIAQKIKTPSLDENPSYNPIIGLKRIGLNGEGIEVYKIRTMYPYSEYLQEYIYQQQQLGEGGKMREDFRVTDWGRTFRKYWVDELPMLYNWVKGDLKLFGVRPLSRQYFNLFDWKLKQIRQKVKPGLIPPYYSDLPKNLAEINDSEKRYIISYFNNPLKTQVSYFFRALGNIFLRGARSG